MSDTQMPTDLQALWDELTQGDDVRRKRIRKQRFDQRAADYAKPPPSEETYNDADVFKVLTMVAGDERYGIEVDMIRGVRAAETITRVPGVPAYYRGVINVRGQIVSVLDLRIFFGLESSQQSTYELVLLHGNDLTLAVLADRVNEVQWVPRQTVQPVEMQYAYGVTANRLVILDMEYLLSDERLIISGDNVL